MGSYRDETFSPTQKIVLAEYPSREEAALAEATLHKYYNIENNKHFANTCNASWWLRRLPENYVRADKPVSEEVREKLRQAALGRKCVWGDKIAAATLGKKKTMTPKALEGRRKAGASKRGMKYKPMSEEGRKNISEAMRGKKTHNTGKKCWNNGIRNTYSVECPGEGWVLGGKALKNPL
ncbi:hypothetical protein Syn7803US42_3 [Synechococcus phage ACG-2014f]|uniref:Nuclease associated modular domain-containing protein n=1 Tax=Synechococcus phage ACG-2014f TaxID=1493511 RepID=A0A0E3FPU8_9CAUD|nr:hypothetical protein Syn7803US42_3 [Synechococcus phage ACG-2014f]